MMRADELEKLLREIEVKDDEQATRSMYCRIGKSAYKTITELAEVSGTKKSEVVRKLVMRGLTGKDIEVAKESVYIKLDWLLRQSKRNQPEMKALFKDVKDISERLESVETASLTSQKLLIELYCMLASLLNAQIYSLGRFIEKSPQNAYEHEHSTDIAKLTIAKIIEFSVNDLDKLANFHALKIGKRSGNKTYIGTKVEGYEKAANESIRKAQAERDSKL